MRNFFLSLCTALSIVFVLFPLGASAATIIPRPVNNLGLVGYWTFDGPDVTDKVYDRSGQGKHGYMIGKATTSAKVQGKLGQAFNFDGQNGPSPNYVDVGQLNVSGAITISLWIKPSAALYTDCASGCDIISTYNSGGTEAQYELSIGSNGALGYSTVNGGVNTGYGMGVNGIPQANRWYHVVLTRTANADRTTDTIIFYIDGVADQSASGSTAQPSTGGYGNTTIGRDGDITSTLFYFPGAIDDVRIYSRVLSPTEVSQLYSSGSAKVGASSATLDAGGIDRGLVGHWTLDGADVTNAVYDRSGNGHNGGFMGGATSSAKVAGKLGQALRFNGANTYANVGLTSVTGDFSLSVWFKGDVDCPVWCSVVSNYNNGGSNGQFALEIDPSKQFNLCNGDTGFYRCWTTTSQTFVAGRWYHLVMTRDAANIDGRIYINGVPQSATVGASPMVAIVSSGFGSTTIGRLGDDPSEYFPGIIDDVRLYNRQLSASEAKQLYNMSAGKLNTNTSNLTRNTTLESGLVAHWTFDGPDFTNAGIADKTGLGNTAYITNSASSAVKVAGKLGQAVRLDGVDDFINLGDGLGLHVDPPFTISEWFYARTMDSAYHTLFTSDTDVGSLSYLTGANLQISNTKKIDVSFGDGTTFGFQAFNGTTVLSANRWYHVVAVVRSGTDMSIYINGVDDSATRDAGSGVNPIAHGTGSGRIGDNSLGGNVFFAGSVDDVRLYNRALSAAEAKQLYNLGR